jgi:hypothetical protein
MGQRGFGPVGPMIYTGVCSGRAGVARRFRGKSMFPIGRVWTVRPPTSSSRLGGLYGLLVRASQGFEGTQVPAGAGVAVDDPEPRRHIGKEWRSTVSSSRTREYPCSSAAATRTVDGRGHPQATFIRSSSGPTSRQVQHPLGHVLPTGPATTRTARCGTSPAPCLAGPTGKQRAAHHQNGSTKVAPRWVAPTRHRRP